MNKNIYLVFYIASCIASLVVTPAYALDETDEQNMTGSAVKILNKYQGRWKGWSDGCMNCDKPLATENPLATKTRTTKDTAKKKSKAQPVPKSLRRGYCACNCESSHSMDSEASKDTTSKGTNCRSANNSDTALKPKSALDSESEKKNTKNDPEGADNKKAYNMDIRDTPRPSEKKTKDVKDNEDEKGQSEQQENSKSRASGKDGVDSSDDITENSAEKTRKEKSKFSIFSFFNSP